MKKKLTVDINISGTTGSGKTTLAFLFWNALHQYGLPANFPNKDGSRILENFGFNLHESIIAIKKDNDIEIKIHEKQMGRIPDFSLSKEVPVEPLELRMYSLVMYNLSPIQQGIQAYHATVEATQNFHDPSSIKEKEFNDWAKNWKTVIVLNGGTSETMPEHYQTLKDNGIGVTFFKEPDANQSMTAVSFIVDERVFNKKKYPDFVNKIDNPEFVPNYQKWVESIGGAKNLFLRTWLAPFRLA